ncbi:MAG: C10 family peptidase, partial [Candidatus Marinimicrobia bacterium]|nr:C10 family peptidase [Candidatus Neomarinimicrobiota bacterium]
MKFTNSLLQLFILVSMVFSSSVNINTATSVANYHITVMDKSLTHSLNSIEAVTDANNVTIGFIAHLSPEGFIGIASDTDIRPITAFSFNSNILVDNDPYNSLYVTFFGDLEFKYNSISSLPQPYKSGSNTLWQKYSTQDPGIVRDGDTQQWPPDGSTSTGGWIEEAWHQNGVNNEYNGMCPIDPVTQERSDTGCGATAIAQILNYHCFIGDKVWTANDGYTSSESGVITIFDDWQLYDFPGIYGTEPNINTLLSSLNVNRYSLGIPLSDTQQNDYDYIRALNFIAGIAVEMQYSSNGSNSSPSGNEFIDDFQYTRADYMDYVSPTFLYALSENMKYAQPALLGSTGGAHSFVCDGYLNDDDNNDFFHLNFGWGDTGPYAIQDMWLDLAEDPFIILDPYEYSLAYGVLNIIPPNQTASISGNVSITSGTGDLSEVEITVGMYSTRPDTNGDYLLVLTDGSYELKCRLIGYNEIVNSITISAGSTNQIDFSLLPATQNTIHVDDDGTADYSTVQGGIDNASDHDIIIIHPGTYLENVILEGKNLIITSQFEIENDPTFIETTIIDGNNFGNTISITPGNYSKIQGFTITGSDQSDYGGGISCLGANIVLDNLIIEANETIRGGGIFISSASPVIKNSRITNNEIQQQGAALSCEYSNPVLDRLLIYGNSSGGIRFHGMNNTNLITNLTIASNQGTGLIVYNSNIEMVNSIIWDNNSQIYESTYSSAEISNSTIEGGWPGNENIPFNPQFVN